MPGETKSPEQLRCEATRDQVMMEFRRHGPAIELLYEGREDEVPPKTARLLTKMMAAFVLAELCIPIGD